MSTAYTPPTDARPTQVDRPWRATIRTALQVGIPTLVALGIAIPLVVQAILDEATKAGVELPGWFTGALVGLAAAVTLVSAILARVMAIPGVEEFLRRHRLVRGLAAAPPPPTEVPDSTITAEALSRAMTRQPRNDYVGEHRADDGHGDA